MDRLKSREMALPSRSPLCQSFEETSTLLYHCLNPMEKNTLHLCGFTMRSHIGLMVSQSLRARACIIVFSAFLHLGQVLTSVICLRFRCSFVNLKKPRLFRSNLISFFNLIKALENLLFTRGTGGAITKLEYSILQGINS